MNQMVVGLFGGSLTTLAIFIKAAKLHVIFLDAEGRTGRCNARLNICDVASCMVGGMTIS